MKHILTIIIAIILFLPLHVSAQTKDIISEGTYNMGDGETPSVAESRALLQVVGWALPTKKYASLNHRSCQI